MSCLQKHPTGSQELPGVAQSLGMQFDPVTLIGCNRLQVVA